MKIDMQISDRLSCLDNLSLFRVCNFHNFIGIRNKGPDNFEFFAKSFYIMG